MAIKTFDIRASNIKTRVDSVTPNGFDGTVLIKFSVTDPRHQNGQVVSLKYGITEWAVPVDEMDVAPDELDVAPEDLVPATLNCTLTGASLQLAENILATGKWTQYEMTWDAKEDLDLKLNEGLRLWIIVQDVDGVDDDVQHSDAFDLNIGVYVEKLPEPLVFLKDRSPMFIFAIPFSSLSINIHFILVISENEDLSNPVQTINSGDDQTGWEFESAGSWGNVGAGGVPDISQDDPYRSRVRHTLQVALDNATTYYYEVTTIVQ